MNFLKLTVAIISNYFFFVLDDIFFFFGNNRIISSINALMLRMFFACSKPSPNSPKQSFPLFLRVSGVHPGSTMSAWTPGLKKPQAECLPAVFVRNYGSM